MDTGTYLCHENEALLNTETTDSGYLEILGRVKADGDTQAGAYSDQHENEVEQLVVYKYPKERNWVFMVRDNAGEVYGEVEEARLTVGLLCAAVTVLILLVVLLILLVALLILLVVLLILLVTLLILLVTLLILHREGRELMIMERAIGRLGKPELYADRDLERFYGRRDEIGMIVQTIHHVCDCHRKTIEDIAFETNILALNASVEAAKSTSALINRSIKDAKTGTESTKHAVSTMQSLNECIQSIKSPPKSCRHALTPP